MPTIQLGGEKELESLFWTEIPENTGLHGSLRCHLFFARFSSFIYRRTLLMLGEDLDGRRWTQCAGPSQG